MAELFARFHRGLNQKRGGKNKLYSWHESLVYCMSKGKEHNRYEFGTKGSITTNRDSKIIIGVIVFDRNQFDGDTLPVVLLQTKRLNGHVSEVALCERGCDGEGKINATHILRSSVKTQESGSAYQALMRK